MAGRLVPGHEVVVRRALPDPGGCCAGSDDIHKLRVDLWRNRPILWTLGALLWTILWDQKFVKTVRRKRLRVTIPTP